jgi:hypothetical protein
MPGAGEEGLEVDGALGAVVEAEAQWDTLYRQGLDAEDFEPSQPHATSACSLIPNALPAQRRGSGIPAATGL